MPTVTLAGATLDDKFNIDETLGLKVACLFIAAFAGGVSSSFVQTSFDDSVKYPRIFKVFVGTFLGAFSGLIALEHFQLGLFTILLPTFVMASLGAPIMVFYLMWMSSAETQAEIKEHIKEMVGRRFGGGK